MNLNLNYNEVIERIKDEPNLAIKDFEFNRYVKKILLKNAVPSTEKNEIFPTDPFDLPQDVKETIISQLEKSGNILKDGDTFVPSMMYYYEAVDKCDLNEMESTLIFRRISGDNLPTIANDFNFSKEKIRQKEYEVLEKINQKYDMNKYIFADFLFEPIMVDTLINAAFKASEKINSKNGKKFSSALYFYNRICKCHNSRSKNNMFNSLSKNLDVFPEWFIDDVIDYYHPVILDNGTVYERYNSQVHIELLKLYGPLTGQELQDYYENLTHVDKKYYKKGVYINEYNSVSDKEADILRKKYYTSLFPLNNAVLRCGKANLLRFYDYKKYEKEIKKILPNLDLDISKDRYRTSEILENRKNKKLLSKIDIHNEYELHSLLKHFYTSVHDKIELGRIPIVKKINKEQN